ncbi:hypothetical protein IQ273_28450, partial [Nodosilinea sp. LEGE 07298]|uniref:hypothetical protein n=1 Tax=Nodosilinea sp. LEGE 07298 TaxID=2777970 RepID=UPI001A0C7741
LQVLPPGATTAPATEPQATQPQATKSAPVVSAQPQPETHVALQLRWSETSLPGRVSSSAASPRTKDNTEVLVTGALYSGY